MTHAAEPSDLELAALISSKICHDVISPVGAIYNGLEILGEDGDPGSRDYAMDVIRNVTVQASARLQFARFAFGAAGSAGAEIDLQTAREISEGFIGDAKHKLTWTAPSGFLPKNQVKLLLNLVAISLNALPRGGTISVSIEEDLTLPQFIIECTGPRSRPPQHLPEIVAGEMPEIDAMSVQAYYTWRLAQNVGAQISLEHDDEIVTIRANHH
ncbi:MAG: histidine phosphotransferase ChpT [Hyphomicrobiaceae bacterium]